MLRHTFSQSGFQNKKTDEKRENRLKREEKQRSKKYEKNLPIQKENEKQSTRFQKENVNQVGKKRS